MNFFSSKKKLIKKNSFKWINPKFNTTILNFNNKSIKNRHVLNKNLMIKRSKHDFERKEEIIDQILQMGKKENEELILKKWNLSNKQLDKFMNSFIGKKSILKRIFYYSFGAFFGFTLMDLNSIFFYLDFLEENRFSFELLIIYYYGNISVRVKTTIIHSFFLTIFFN